MATSSCESRARTVCLTCGDEGDKGLLIYCIKCQDSAHLYCLDDISSNDDRTSWKCWDCTPRVDKVESSRKSERISRRTDRAIEARMNLEKKLYPMSSYTVRNFVSTNHGFGETSQLTGDGSPPVLEIKKSSDDIDGNMELTDCESKSKLKDTRNSQENFDKVEADFYLSTSNIHDIGFSSPKRLIVGMSESAQLEGDSSISIDRMENVQSFAELPRNQEVRKKRRRLMIDDSSSSEEDGPINVEESSLVSQKYVGPLNTSNSQLSEPQCELFAQPIMNPIWRGCFSIICEKNETNLGILAHLSKKACSKVSDIAIVLPPVLVVEVLSKCSVWPKSFQSLPPTDASIDLYLFPEYQRDEKVYDGLLDEIIEGDHALKAMIKDLELLIFSSRELPLAHWRFQLKYYLWGVFQQTHGSLPDNSRSNETVTPFKRTNQSGNMYLSHSKAKRDRTPHSQTCYSPFSTSSSQYSAFLATSRSASEDSPISSSNISVAEKIGSS